MKERFSYELYKTLKSLLELNNRDISELIFNKNQIVKSISLYKTVLLSIPNLKTISAINIRQSFIKMLDKYNVNYTKSKSDTIYVRINFNSDVHKFICDNAKLFIDIYDDIFFRNCPDSFSCCSKYIECSNNLSCIQENKELIRLCKYKRNLRNGIVFYGNNSVLNKDNSINENKVISNKEKIQTEKIILPNPINDNDEIRLTHEDLVKIKELLEKNQK